MRTIEPEDGLLSATWIGPVGKAIYSLRPVWSGETSVRGFRKVTISGTVEIRQAEQLNELISNPDMRHVYGGVDGVLEYVAFGAAIAGHYSGWYVLEGCPFSPLRPGDSIPFVPISIEATYIGLDRELVGVHSAILRSGVAYSGTAESVFADPFPIGESIVRPPGGMKELVTFDPDVHDFGREAADLAEMTTYVGTLTESTDELNAVVVLAPEGG